MTVEAAIVRSLSRVSRLTGHGGSVLGGRVVLALDPQALRRLGAGRRVCLVSGTNGKTTTTAMLSAAAGQGCSVVTNTMGANLMSGLVTALAGDPAAQIAVLEVDEAVLPVAARTLRPSVVVLLNLSRDQLDRFGEVRHLAAAWREMCSDLPGTGVVANADDPLVAWAASASADVRWVGAGLEWRSDAAACPACGERIEWRGNQWSCTSCSLVRPEPCCAVADGGLTLDDGGLVNFALGLPGRCNNANAAMAITAATVLGLDPVDAARALTGIVEVEGRYRQTRLWGTSVRLLLAKNPAGWHSALDMLRPAPFPVLILINAQGPDGRDPSWLWDVPFERVGSRRILVGGDRALDLAVRLRYAGLEHEVLDGDLEARLTRADVDELDVIANYSAFQGLVRRG